MSVNAHKTEVLLSQFNNSIDIPPLTVGKVLLKTSCDLEHEIQNQSKRAWGSFGSVK